MIPVRVIIALCLGAPFVAMLWVGSYDRIDPAIIGIPFFYWYQLLWVLLCAPLMAVAYRLSRRDQRAREAWKDGVRKRDAPQSDARKDGARKSGAAE